MFWWEEDGSMRLRDFLTEHAIPWPPIVFAPMSAGSKALVPGDLRLATLLDVQWSEDDGDTTIDLRSTWMASSSPRRSPVRRTGSTRTASCTTRWSTTSD
jgi:hypothetical protein